MARTGHCIDLALPHEEWTYTRDMTIAVFGASGKVGSLVTQKLLADGHHVRAFVHGSSPFKPRKSLEVIQGDIHLSDDVERALAGCHAVISCLGSWGTPSKDILTVAMHHIVPAMNAHKITRLVSLTGSGAALPGEKLPLIDRLNRALLLVAAGKILRDGEEHLRILSESNLDWTVLRSPVMTSGNETPFSLSGRAPSPLATIPRASVVTALVSQLSNYSHLKRAPHIHRS